ncbi:MAG: IS3 family transposase [Eubacteriales bacterium]
MQSLFEENHRCYGYRRIHVMLKKARMIISEKVVRRLMAEENLLVYVTKKEKQFSSYVGEIDEAPENLVKRNFHADDPNQLWLTDISEFAIPAGNIYLSPILDCFDEQITSWTSGCHPTAELANSMLADAVINLPEGAHPIIHSDRGGHYRWLKWVEITEQAGLTRSISRKGRRVGLCWRDSSP